MDATAIAAEILEGIGGKENVNSLSYCASRLRLVLKDYNLVDDVQVRGAEAVKDTFHTRGQYQIIIGPGTVKPVHDALNGLITGKATYDTANQKVARTILEGIGGQANLNSLAYCATRLRLELQDYEQLEDAKIRALEAVTDTFVTRGQYQIILGLERVKGVYDELTALVQQPVSGEKREYGSLTRVAKSLMGKR